MDTAALFRELIEKTPSDIWLRWRYAELLSAYLKDEPTASEQCRAVQKILPCSYRSHLLLALSQERQNHWSEAITYLSKVLQIKPTSAEAYYHLGLAYQSLAQADKAIHCFSEMIRLQPNHREGYLKTAALLSQQGRIDAAIGILDRGSRSIPDDPVLHFNLGVLLDRRQRRNEAVQEFRTALRIDPNSVEIRRMLESVQARTD